MTEVSTTCRVVAMAASLSVMLATFDAAAEESTPGWQHSVFIYGVAAGIDGSAQIGNVEVDIDASASDVIDQLEMGGMAAYRVENGTWSFTTDATYFALGANQTSGNGRLKAEIDVDQATFMATVGRRWTEHLEFLAGLAYVDLRMEAGIKSRSSGAVDVSGSRDADWIDPTVGLLYSRPLGDCWRLNLRGDIGGFGVGSDFMYHMLVAARWQASGNAGVFFGYRVISFDYENGDDRDYQHYDLVEQGPMIGASIAF